MIKTVLKRWFSLFLALALILGLIPVFATEVSAAGTVNPGVTGLTASYDNGTWNANSSQHSITGSVKTTTSTSCGNTTYTAVTGTLTLKNTSGAKATLSFTPTVTLNGGSATINGTAAASQPYSFVLAANESVSVVITSSDSAENTTSITLSNVSLVVEKDVNVTFTPAENGSYTVDGTPITASTTLTKKSTESFAVSAAADSGYTFGGWITGGDTSNVVSSNAVDSLTFTENTTVTAYFIDSSTPMFDVGGKAFTNLSAAVSYAQSNNKSKITLIKDGVLPAGSYTIPSGITLLIPYDSAHTVVTSVPTVMYNSYVTPTAFKTLTMAPGASITVQNGGALCLGGALSSKGQLGGYNGTPTGPDGRIRMQSGSSITVNSGANLYCWGYIYGSGSVEALSGATVYEAFQIKDWRGGTATSNVYDYAFIFNQYYIQNIEVPLKINAGATEKLYSSVNASGSAYPMSATLVGANSSSGGLFAITSGYVIKDYIESTDRLSIDVYGNVSVSSMTMSGLPMIGSVNTSGYILPITSNLTINLHSGTTSVTQDIELLPSTEISIDRGATFQINSGKKVYVYDNDDWGNFSGSTRMYPIGYSVANGTTAIRTAAGLTDAKIDVNGTLTVAGSLFTSSGGGNITSSLGTENGTGKIVFTTAPTATATIYETTNNSTKTAVSFYAPHFRNGDESYSDSTGTGTSTWYYDKDGEHWYRFLVDFVYSGSRVGRGYFCENNSTVSFDVSWLTNPGASVSSGSASASISGGKVNVTGVTSNATVTLTGTAAKFIPTFVLNEKQYQNYQLFTGNTLSETRTINGETWYVVSRAGSALDVGAACAAPTDASMGVTAANHNSIVWNLSGLSANSGQNYNGTVPVGDTPNGEVYIYGFYNGAVAYNSATDQYYSTLKAALLDVPQTGTCTVQLIADCGSFEEESGAESLVVLEGSNLTLDLNGFHALGALTNNGNLTLDLNGGLWEYHTGAEAAAAAYQGKAAVTNNGTLTLQDTAGGGRITADAISNAGIPNHAAVLRNNQSGTLTVTGGTLENVQDVNNYTSLVLNDRGTITALQNLTLRSPRGYAVFNYGGQIALMDGCDIDVAYGICNRNVRGGNTIAAGYNIANYGVIDTIQNCVVTAGQYAVYNNAVINLLEDCTFTAHPDSAQVNTYGTSAANVQGNVACYTVYNNNAWWYDTNVWKRTDNTSSSYVRTDEYREEEEYRPTIGTIRDCSIYAENTSTSAEHGCALYNNGGVIGTITGNTEIKTYKHPSNAKSISSNYALRNTAGGIIHSVTGSPEIRASGTGAFYNDGQFTTRTVNFYGNKIGGVQLHNQTTYGSPSTVQTVNCSGVFAAGAQYGIMNSGKIGVLTGGLTVSANYNALYNSPTGATTSYDFVRTYTDNTDASTETKREETYVRNTAEGSVINTIDGVHFVGTGNNSYYLLQNQGKIGSLKNSDFTADKPKAGEGYAMILNGDSRQSGLTLAREPFAYDSYYITPYEYHIDYDVTEIDEIDNITVTKNATFAFRNLGRINALKNSSFTGTQYVFVNTVSGPYVERDYVRYYSGTSKFATTKNNGSDLTTAYTRLAAEIGTMQNNTITGTSTYALYNGGHLGTLTGNTISSTNTTVFSNSGASIRSFTSNILDIISVTATDSACTVIYGNDAKVNVTDYDAPAVDLIGAGNHLSGTYQVLVNLGVITAINGGSDPVTISSTTQKQVGGIYNYAGTLDARTATTPYTDGTAGTAVNEDSYLSAHIGSIKNTIITANGIGIQNGSSNATYLPVIDELGEGLEVHANCTTAGYHTVLNTTYAKIAAITGGIYDAATATTNAYRNNNTVAEQATLISGGDFKGMADTRTNAIFEPDNTSRQTYPTGKSLSTGAETVTFHDGTTGEGYYFVGTTVTVTFDANGGTGTMEPQTAAADKAFTLNANAFTREGYEFTGWNTQADGQGTAYADGAAMTLSADLTLYAQWRAVRLVDVYFVDQDDNPEAYVYAFGPGVENAAFPGVPVTAQGVDEHGDNWYKLTLDANVYTGVIFSGGTQATQTTDLGLGTGNAIVYYVNNHTGYAGDDLWPAPPVEVEATCTQPGSVTYTGLLTGATHVTETPALGHDWSDWATTTQPTCTAAGEKTRSCSRCDAVETETLAALGHNYEDVVTAPTCTAGGYTTHTCSRCGDSYTDTPVAALGHDFGEWTVTTEPTCTEAGVKTRSCSRCGTTETETVEALGHDYVAVVTEPTCTEAGYTTHTCSRCGDSYTDTPVAALGHDWSDWTLSSEATCTQGGLEARTCSRCGETETRPIEALGHRAGTPAEENRVEPTCTNVGGYDLVTRCTRCGVLMATEHHEIAALGHDWSDWATTTEPTCTEAGVKTRTCSRCGTTETEAVEALGHDYVAVVTEPTCTEAGYTTHTCSRCGDSYTDTPVAALGHDFGEWTVTTEPTCTEAGVKTRSCSRCDAVETEAVEALGHDYVAVVTEPTCTEAGYTTHTCSRCGDSYTDTPVAALGHDWSDWTTTTEPTCTETGVKTRTCSRCDAVETETVEALGHDYVAVVTEPTCTEAGYTTHTCSRCGDSYTDTPVAALGHDFGEWTVTTEPTCTEAGVKTRSCSRCDTTETETVEALGHDYVAVVTEPTCTEAGYTTHTCSRCGDSYTDTPVAALGHDWSDWATSTEPTCTEAGVKTRSCSRCDAVETETVETLGHDYVAVVTEPTCTEAGYTTHTCSRCGDSYTDTETPALGHDFGEWTVTTEPTCTGTGVKTRSCTRCTETENEVLEALGHLPAEAVQENYVEPTATEEGGYDMVVYCQRCGAELSREHTVLPATAPIETANLEIFYSISVGTDMIISFNTAKASLTNYEKFWIEVIKHEPTEDKVYKYGVDQEEALLDSNQSWKARFNHIFAKEMGLDVEARVYAQDANGQVWMSPAISTTIRDYLGGRLTATTNKVEQRVLAADMLNYGAAAQLFLDYDTDHLVNEELTAEQLAKLEEYETKELPPVEKTNSNYKPEGATDILFTSVTLGNEVLLKLTVNLPETTEGVQVLVKDHLTGNTVTTLETSYSGSSFRAVYNDIGASKMRTEYDLVTVVNGVETGNTRTWSVEAYVGEIRTGSLPLKTDLANALLTYGDSAAAYKATQQTGN